MRAIDVGEAEVNRLKELEEVERLLYTLHEIAAGSDEGETVRLALVALTSTKIGQDYMRENPITI